MGDSEPQDGSGDLREKGQEAPGLPHLQPLRAPCFGKMAPHSPGASGAAWRPAGEQRGQPWETQHGHHVSRPWGQTGALPDTGHGNECFNGGETQKHVLNKSSDLFPRAVLPGRVKKEKFPCLSL